MKLEEKIEQLEKDIRLNRAVLPNPEEDACHQMARLLVEDGYCRARDIVDIIERRIAINAERHKGVDDKLWQAIYTAREHAYNDIKEIIEKEYTEE